MRWLGIFFAANIAICAVLFGILWATTDLFTSGDGTMGIHGWIAMGLGIFFTSALGIGLMSLVFYSHRSQADEQANSTHPEDLTR
ncbi:MAG TPA: hypothetical protein VGO34_08710 [Alphaproteobacteria bacterium]|jgi:hypothetical protein